MARAECDGEAEPAPRPRHELAEIVRVHGAAVRASRALTDEQRKALWDIEHCRTAMLGGHLDKCQDCGDERPSYNYAAPRA